LQQTKTRSSSSLHSPSISLFIHERKREPQEVAGSRTAMASMAPAAVTLILLLALVMMPTALCSRSGPSSKHG
uniref:Uncharacterized protein n=1 Tax=Oryza brachyantha TaxID=4533 RepID=J3MPP0_ORYBR